MQTDKEVNACSYFRCFLQGHLVPFHNHLFTVSLNGLSLLFKVGIIKSSYIKARPGSSQRPPKGCNLLLSTPWDRWVLRLW